MGLEPGAVSPLGLMNDSGHAAIVIIDAEVWNAETVIFHPNVNNASLEVPGESFHRLMESFENEMRIMEL